MRVADERADLERRPADGGHGQIDERKRLVDRCRVDHDARVQPVVGIPDLLEPAEERHHLRRIHQRQQCAASAAVAVLTREGTTVAHHDLGGVAHELLEPLPPLGGAQFEVDAHMHASGAEVPVHGGRVPVLLDERKDLSEIIGKLLRCNGRVFPARPRLHPVQAFRRQTRTVFADAPQPSPLERVGDDHVIAHTAGRLQTVSKVFTQGGGASDVVRRILDNDVRLPGRQGAHAVFAAAMPHDVDDGGVKALDRARPLREHHGDIARRVDRRVIADTQERDRTRLRHKPHPGTHRNGAGALTAGERARDVESVLGQQVGEMVARHLARDGLQLSAQGGEIIGREIEQCAVEVVRSPPRMRVVPRRGDPPGARPQVRTVEREQLDLEYVVRHAAVFNRVVAARIVAERPPDRGTGV